MSTLSTELVSFIVRRGSVIMEQLHTILSNALLVFQLCLGLWQIGKLTPVGGLVQGGIGWLLSLLPFGAFLSPTYALLRHFPGRVFKQVFCGVLTNAAGSRDELFPAGLSREYHDAIAISYLGDEHTLERRDGNKLFVDDKMSYYITDAIWNNLLVMGSLSAFYKGKFVFLRGYKEFWELVVTGGVMKFPEVLDGIILDSHTIMVSDADWLLPVNLSLSEEKVLKVLNLVGLFLQTKKVFWLIPTLLSLVSAMLEFNTTLRSWLYTKINKVFCWSMHLVCDRLSYSKRRHVYSLGKWVENLKPSNDLQLKVVKDDICAVIAGGAKADKEDAALVKWLNLEEGETQKTFLCDPLVMYCSFDQDVNRCSVAVMYSSDKLTAISVDCKGREEYMKICTLVDCMAKCCSGSLKSYDSKTKKVHVNGWKDSVRHYIKGGCPSIYQLK